MDNVRQWVMTVSSVSIISGVLISLLPKSSQKTLYKSIAAIVMVYAFLQPFTYAQNFEININDYLSENYEVSNNIDEYALSSVIDSAEKAIENLLIQEAQKIDIDCSFKCVCDVEDNEIYVKKLIISPKQNADISRKIFEIADSLGINNEVIVFEGEKDEY